VEKGKEAVAARTEQRSEKEPEKETYTIYPQDSPSLALPRDEGTKTRFSTSRQPAPWGASLKTKEWRAGRRSRYKRATPYPRPKGSKKMGRTRYKRTSGEHEMREVSKGTRCRLKCSLRKGVKKPFGEGKAAQFGRRRAGGGGDGCRVNCKDSRVQVGVTGHALVSL